MQGIKQIGSVTCTAMAVFLFSYSVSLSLSSSKDYPQASHDTFTKSGKLPVNPENQFPFEEKDEEQGNEFQDSFSMVCVLIDVFSFISIKDQFSFIHHGQRLDRMLSCVPIYLAKRSLII